MTKGRRVSGPHESGGAGGSQNSVRLTAEAGAHLARLAELHDQPAAAVLSRAVRWLVQQDEVVQLSVLRAVSDRSLAVLAAEALNRGGAGEAF